MFVSRWPLPSCDEGTAVLTVRSVPSYDIEFVINKMGSSYSSQSKTALCSCLSVSHLIISQSLEWGTWDDFQCNIPIVANSSVADMSEAIDETFEIVRLSLLLLEGSSL